MRPATRSAALQPARTRYTEVPVPEQGLVYRLRSMSEAERQFYRRVLCTEDDPEQNQLALIAFTVVDAEGRRLFEDSDVDALKVLDSAVTMRLYQAALNHCSFEEGTDLGNSPRIPPDCSP